MSSTRLSARRFPRAVGGAAAAWGRDRRHAGGPPPHAWRLPAEYRRPDQDFCGAISGGDRECALIQDVETSLEDLRTAQDRLVQTEKLASLGQLTAGIAHEIKNPLNFVNNFSGVSVELIDELREALGRVKARRQDARMRSPRSTNTLRDNLDKIVQHGKRADAIVKNMLLHSREGSGEHRPVDINALVEESLNLAYHGARAEKQGFTITLERSFDPAAGEVDLFPQEITRALLNLISNGFYAATKRKAEANGDATTSQRLPPRPRTSATGSKSAFATTAPAFRPR